MNKLDTNTISVLKDKIKNLEKEIERLNELVSNYSAWCCNEKYLDEGGNEQCDPKLSMLHGIRTKAIFDKSGKLAYCKYHSTPNIKSALTVEDIRDVIRPVLIVPIFENMKIIND